MTYYGTGFFSFYLTFGSTARLSQDIIFQLYSTFLYVSATFSQGSIFVFFSFLMSYDMHTPPFVRILTLLIRYSKIIIISASYREFSRQKFTCVLSSNLGPKTLASFRACCQVSTMSVQSKALQLIFKNFTLVRQYVVPHDR